MQDNLNEKMSKILENKEFVDRHSFFQLKHFLIHKEPTLQSKLWRCLRELKSRKDEIDFLQIQVEETTDEETLLNMKISKLESKPSKETIDKEENDIKIRQLRRKKIALDKNLEELQKKLKEKSEEAKFFMEFFEELEKKEKLKPFDDLQSQEEYWNAKLNEELKLRLMLRQPIGVELAKTIMSMRDESRIKRELVQIIKQIQHKAEVEAKMVENKN